MVKPGEGVFSVVDIIDLRGIASAQTVDAFAEDYVLLEGSPDDYVGLPQESGGYYSGTFSYDGHWITVSNAKGFIFTDGNTDYLPDGFTSEIIEVPVSTPDAPMVASMASLDAMIDDEDSVEALTQNASESLLDDVEGDGDFLSADEGWDFDALSLDDEFEGGSDMSLVSLDSVDVSGEDLGDADISDLVSDDDQWIPGLEPDDTIIKDSDHREGARDEDDEVVSGPTQEEIDQAAQFADKLGKSGDSSDGHH
ncbi:MAG TPA: hypothetical protein VK049_00010 [Paenalcaligenes sp.]|nr:hypothetical protein [Paenalcaligenes sp.]